MRSQKILLAAEESNIFVKAVSLGNGNKLDVLYTDDESIALSWEDNRIGYIKAEKLASLIGVYKNIICKVIKVDRKWSESISRK